MSRDAFSEDDLDYLRKKGCLNEKEEEVLRRGDGTMGYYNV